MAQRHVTLVVTRYNPERAPEPYAQSYRVPVSHGMMVLDALTYVRDELDPSLAFRWSCRMGICGSCGMTVNGAPRLTCEDPVARYGPRLHVAPLDHFPVLRDLVVDMTDFFDGKLPAVQPWLLRQEERPLAEGEHRQTPAQIAAYAPHAACINCLLCYAACPVYGFAPQFLGPAAIALARRYNLDSRDQGAAHRRHVLARPEAVWECTFVGECSVVCPRGVQPAEAIQRSKADLAQRWALGALTPRRRR